MRAMNLNLYPRILLAKRALRGSMMIELLIGCVIASLTGAALVSLQQSSYVANATVLGQNFANASSRRPLDILGDTLRNAQIGPGNRALVSASASDVTCYTATGNTRIWLDSSAHVLRRQKVNNIATIEDISVGTNNSQALVTNVQSLQITYYMPSGSAYNASVAGWTTTADPNAPSYAELPGVGAVNIVATVTANGETRTLQSFVRMRNSPNTHDS